MPLIALAVEAKVEWTNLTLGGGQPSDRGRVRRRETTPEGMDRLLRGIAARMG